MLAEPTNQRYGEHLVQQTPQNLTKKTFNLAKTSADLMKQGQMFGRFNRKASVLSSVNSNVVALGNQTQQRQGRATTLQNPLSARASQQNPGRFQLKSNLNLQ